MSTLAFVLFWVVLGLGLLYIALRGGKRSRDRRPADDRRSRKLAYLGFGLALLTLGIVIPALILADVRGDEPVPEAGLASLTDREQRGRELFAEQCRLCHTLEAAAASAVVGPNLDTLRPTYGLTLDAIENGRARGNGAMAADLVTGEDAEAVAAFVAKAVGQGETIGAETTTGGEAEAEGGESPVQGDQEAGGGEQPQGGDAGPGEGGAGDTPAGTTEND